MSFGVTVIGPALDGEGWIMEFFDARTEWTFAEFVQCLRDLGAPFADVPDPPSTGFAIVSVWRGEHLTAGYSDDYGCHLISPSKSTSKLYRR
jgi:hypothetical protein